MRVKKEKEYGGFSRELFICGSNGIWKQTWSDVLVCKLATLQGVTTIGALTYRIK